MEHTLVLDQAAVLDQAVVLDQAASEPAESHAISALSAPAPAHDEIARLAYALWEARGDGGGSAEEDWHNAERALRNSRLV
jgi:Protein of unknown function (DUF2934)